MDEVLAQSGLFQGLPDDSVEPVASRLETMNLPRGRVVFSEGEPGRSGSGGGCASAPSPA